VTEQAKPPNGVVTVLNSLATSTNKWVQLGTLGLIAFTGIGNWLSTRHESEISRQINSEEQERTKAEVIREVREIHTWIQEAVNDADSSANRRMLNELIQWKRKQQAKEDEHGN
jgi:hypothetical protein